MNENNSLLEIKNLSALYKTDLETVYAVNDISFCLNQGETLGLVGETGAGKTTTALSIMQLLPERTGKITAGEIIFEGEDLLKKSERELQMIRGEKIAMIFQDPMTSLNPVHTIGRQISEALELHNHQNRSAEEIQARVDQVLELVGIDPARKLDYPHQLSGGMKQRIVIAMALACEPELLIADEPTTALDVTIQAQVIKMIRELRDRLGTSMIMITHDLGIVAQTCDKVAVMYAGRIVEYGTAEQVFTAEKKHPYTEGLFNSIPDIHSKAKRLKPIPGLMPDPTIIPEGCAFASRCPYATESCAAEAPELFEENGHLISCSRFSTRKET